MPIIFGFLFIEVQAQTTRTWSGGDASSGNWTSGANWVGDEAPVPVDAQNVANGDPLIFTGSERLENTVNFAKTDAGFGLVTFDSSAGDFVVNNANPTGRISTNGWVVEAGAGHITVNTGIFIRQSAGGVFAINGSTSQMTVNGVIGGFGTVGALTKTGEGTLVLTAANTYARQTSIRNGTVRVSHLGDIGTAGNLGTANNGSEHAIVIGYLGDTATLEYVGEGESNNRFIQVGTSSGDAGATGGATILANGSGALQFTRATFNEAVNSSSAGRTLTLGGTNTGNNTIHGVIQNNLSSRVVRVEKTGVGTWILAGANTYTGNTTIKAGTLLITGDMSAATGQVIVETAGTLGGNGIVGGATTVSGNLAPGNSPGVLSFNSTLTLSPTATTTFEIDGTTRGSQYDGIDVLNSALLTYGGDLILDFGTPLGAGTFTFDLFSFGGSYSGNFASVTITGEYSLAMTYLEGVWTAALEDSVFTFTPTTGDLVVEVVPEPATWMLLALSLAMVVIFSRRRRLC